MFIITQWCTRPPWTSPPSSSWTHPCSPAASYLTLLLTRATLPSGWEPPEDQTLFCPSLHPNRAQHSALNSFSPTSSVPSRIKDRTPQELLKTMPSSNILRSSQAPCSAKQANQALPLLVCQVNPTQSAKPSWDVNSFWRPQPARKQDHPLMCGHKRLCRHFNLCMVTPHSYSFLPQFPLLYQELLKGWDHLFKKPLCLSGSVVCPVLGKCSINVSCPMRESAGIDSLGQEQSYSWRFLRRKNQSLAPQGLLSVFLYLAWPNLCLWALTVPWFLFKNSFFLQAYEGMPAWDQIWAQSYLKGHSQTLP